MKVEGWSSPLVQDKTILQNVRLSLELEIATRNSQLQKLILKAMVSLDKQQLGSTLRQLGKFAPNI